MLGLHHQLARGVEERRRAVVALLDVGRVGGADQHRAHLVAGGAQAADHHLEGDRVEASGRSARRLRRHDRAGLVDRGASSPAGSTRVASGSSKTHGPSRLEPGRRLAAEHSALDPLAVEARPALAPRSAAAAGRPRARLGPRLDQRERGSLTSSTVAVGVAVAVARLVLGARSASASSSGSGSGGPGDRQLEGLARGSAARRRPRARRLVMPSPSALAQLVDLGGDPLGA